MSYETKHTPGPWRWEVNLKCKSVNICGGGGTPYDLTVMSFDRWGMSGAQPNFHVPLDKDNADWGGMIKKSSELTAVVHGREHHADWFQAIDHPDAHLIAAAPDLLEALIDLVQENEGRGLATTEMSAAKSAIEKALNYKK